MDGFPERGPGVRLVELRPEEAHETVAARERAFGSHGEAGEQPHDLRLRQQALGVALGEPVKGNAAKEVESRTVESQAGNRSHMRGATGKYEGERAVRAGEWTGAVKNAKRTLAVTAYQRWGYRGPVALVHEGADFAPTGRSP